MVDLLLDLSQLDHNPAADQPQVLSLQELQKVVLLLTPTFNLETDLQILMAFPTLITRSSDTEYFRVVPRESLKAVLKLDHKAVLREVLKADLRVNHNKVNLHKVVTRCHGITRIFPTRAFIQPTAVLLQVLQASNQESCSQGWALTTSQALEITSLVAPPMVSNNKPC